MPDTLQAISRSLSTDVQILGAISHNVANVNTPGYRGVRAIPEFGVQVGLQTGLDQSDGALAQTERKLDLALRGPGFFTVERDGKTLLTRAGAFHLDVAGQLVNARGDQVIGTNGPIILTTSNVRVDGHGEIWDGTQSVGQLQMVTAADAAALRPAGDGAYFYDGDPLDWEGTVVQGALESANVDPANETIHLMETTRHAESVQRAISIYDKVLDQGINHLGEN